MPSTNRRKAIAREMAGHIESNQLHKCVLINKHYLAEQVDAFLKSVDYSNMNVQTIFDGAAARYGRDSLEKQGLYKSNVNLMIHADNATDISLDKLITAHLNRAPGCILTMLTFNTDSPETYGIVKTDKQGIVVEFHEKKSSPPVIALMVLSCV